MSIRTTCAALAGALLLSGCATMGSSTAGGPIVGPIREGRCHMNGCSWFQVQSFDVVRENEKGALLRVVAREGSTMHPDGNYPRRPRESAVQWTGPSTTYFFCSTRYPAMIDGDGGSAWRGYRLNMTTIYGVTEFVQNQYRAVCHPDGDFDGSEAAARRLGYTPFEGEAEFTVSRPEDVFDRVP